MAAQGAAQLPLLRNSVLKRLPHLVSAVAVLTVEIRQAPLQGHRVFPPPSTGQLRFFFSFLKYSCILLLYTSSGDVPVCFTMPL